MLIRILLLFMALSVTAVAQVPPIEPGVSQELAQWRAVRYSNVRYKLNLTLEKMSQVLKGTMEIKLQYAAEACAECPPRFVVLDWRKIRGHEEKSTISNVSINGKIAVQSSSFSLSSVGPEMPLGSDVRDKSRTLNFFENNEHLIFSDGVEMGENVIKLDFTSPILPSGSAITRYVDKEDGSGYIYSLFVPSDASTAFPVFDQPDLKARFELTLNAPPDWKVVGNTYVIRMSEFECPAEKVCPAGYQFVETKPISTYVFAFAAGPFEKVDHTGGNLSGSEGAPLRRDASWQQGTLPTGRVSASGAIYVRKSQAAKFKPHAAEVFRLNREAIKYFEQYFDYKFPFPKYDLVLIPEFPFGGMEHAGATFLREASIIFPQEPTKSDHVSRATLIFHEAAHQWFGDTVTMRWFDDLWLKEGFANFAAYKALEKIMPEMNAWKVFYERIKQGAYQTDSTKGTTPIYQEIKNLSAAKSAYGNIVYNKAPAFLRQAEFYLGEAKFQTAVRAFLKKHQYKNATWEDFVRELNKVYEYRGLPEWASYWVSEKGVPLIRTGIGRAHVTESRTVNGNFTEDAWLVPSLELTLSQPFERSPWALRSKTLFRYGDDTEIQETRIFGNPYAGYLPRIRKPNGSYDTNPALPDLIFPNYQDYGYGIFLLDEKSRDYVLKNIQNEKDPFLRSMMWGSLWDSVREGELDPREYVELVVKVLMQKPAREQGLNAQADSQALANARASAIEDESTTALLLSRVGTAMNYYIDTPGGNASVNERGDARRGNSGSSARSPRSLMVASLPERVEEMLIAGMHNAPTLGQRITYYRAFLNIASSEKARGVLKTMLIGGNLSGSEGAPGQRGGATQGTLPTGRVSASIPLKTKDKFDIVTRLLILNDPEAPKLLADLEKTETSDDAKRYAYAAKAGIGTAEDKARYWNDFVNNKEISESWIEAAFGPWNSIRHSSLTLPYLQRALQELPNHKRSRKIFFVNGWLGAFIGGQRSEEALGTVNKFLADNPTLDNDLRLKILENVDVIERAVKIRQKHDR